MTDLDHHVSNPTVVAAQQDPNVGRNKIENLIVRCASGDRGAFELLYDATNGKLFAVCVRVLGKKAAAEDAMQDTYIKIWENAGRYRVTGHSPMSWLITIARNTAIDRARAQRGESDVADYEDVLAAPGPNPEQSAIAASEANRISQCLDTLSKDARIAITGAYLEGRSYVHLAEHAGVPLNTMRTWLRRGLIALRECMAQ